MEDDTSFSAHTLKQWVPTIVLGVVFLAVFGWLQFYTAGHSIRGNALLSGWALAGVVITLVYASLVGFNAHGIFSWVKEPSKVFLRIAFGLAILFVWYLIAVFLPWEEGRRLMTYAPFVALAFLAIRWGHEASRERRKLQNARMAAQYNKN
jgi:amino acid transporter